MILSYAFKRTCYFFSIFAAIVLISFFLFHMIPADPARIILGPNADEAQVSQLRKELGLDLPLYTQLFNYTKDVAGFDFGKSYVDGRDIGNEILYRLKITAALTGLSLIITFLYLGFVLNVLNSRLRYVINCIDFLSSSVPIFFSGIVAAILTIYFYPVSSFSGTFSVNDFFYLIPPAFVLSLYPMAILSGVLKQEFSVLHDAPFIVAEKALGFSNIIILFRYFGKNAMIPVLSTLSSIFPIYITGTFIVEIIFSIPGISSVIVKSIMGLDFPMLEATVIVNGLIFILINLGFEFIYPIIDPRVLKGRQG